MFVFPQRATWSVCSGVSQNTKHNYTDHPSFSTFILPLLTSPQGHWRCGSQAVGRDTPGHHHSHHSHWHLEHFPVSTQPWIILLWSSRAHWYCHSSLTYAKFNQWKSWETEPKLKLLYKLTKLLQEEMLHVDLWLQCDEVNLQRTEKFP